MSKEKRPIETILEQLNRMMGYVSYANLKSYVIDSSDWTRGNQIPNSLIMKLNFKQPKEVET